MNESVRSGRTTDEAVAVALEDLAVSRELCRVEVINEGSRGLFGLLGSRELRVRVSVQAGRAELAAAFLRTATRLLDCPGEVSAAPSDEGVHLSLRSPQAGPLIGRRGQVLDALQLLAEAHVSRHVAERERLLVDVEGYRERRHAMVTRLAKRAARDARRTGHFIELEPMPASERRIVHLALQEEAGVTTESTGTEPNRRVVIRPDS